MKPASSKDTLTWLRTQPPLAEMRERCPEDWAAVEEALAGILARKEPEALQAYLADGGVAMPAKPGARPARAQTTRLIRARMAQLAMKGHFLRAATGVAHGKIRFNLFNGFIAQRLLFKRGLERKPASLFWFRLFWPLVWQRKRLMPLVEPKGIYCFYTRELVRALAALIGGRACLEIAAGDGTLGRFLREAGVDVTATDDQSWTHAVAYPESVVKLDAAQALARYKPRVVICSWPPMGNGFEQTVFATDSVELYVVIGSRQRHGFGNWQTYRRQTAFVMEEDARLGRLVLPPELEPAVYVFRRGQEEKA